MKIRIQKAKQEDAEKILELKKRSIEASIDPDYKNYKSFLLDLNSKEDIIKEIKSGCLFTATENSTILATLTLDNDTIKGFYVEPIHMKKGIGSLFLDDIEERAKKKNINKLLLTCNKASLGFYKKKGFKIKKTIIDKNLLINRYIMEKIL